jgi:CRISPR/Cas system-associated exonuclease Cas4 (RecB family)
MIRMLSYSEVAAALECPARHAFRYTGALTNGQALQPKLTAPMLRDGRAWGAGAAAYLENSLRTDGLVVGHTAIDEALKHDADEQRDAGVYDPEVHAQAAERLHAMLDHYAATTEPLELDRLEEQLVVPIPSRTGKHASSRYRLLTRFDGTHVDAEGRYWLVELKLRRQLQPLALIVLSRQIRWYAYAYETHSGVPITGVIVDERLNETPAAVRHNKNGQVSRVQSCTPDAYLAACQEVDQEPAEDVLDGLRSKNWQHRHRIMLRPAEIEEAGRELVGAARLIQELDTGRLYPLRHPGRARCPGCPFKDICGTPDDEVLIDALFDRRPPKKDCDPEEAIAA